MQATIKTVQPIPESLRCIPDAPSLLCARGELPREAPVAIVGTRKPTAYGRRITTLLAGRFGRSGIPVVSGLAFGIDAIAHEAVLASGGRTIAVLPCGLADQDVSPRTNLPLARRILSSSGALVSEYAEGTPARKEHYEARNRLISGLARVVIVVEAGRPSGTLITARHAGEQGKDVWAVPGPIDSPQSVGSNWLVETGAIPLVSVDAFLKSLGVVPPPARNGIERLFEGKPRHIDELLERSGKAPAELEGELAKLELLGSVRHLGGRYYALS